MSHPVVDFHYLCHHCNKDVLFISSTNIKAPAGSLETLTEYGCLPCQTFYTFSDFSKSPFLITMEVEMGSKLFTMNWFIELGVFTVCNEDKLVAQIFSLPDNVTPANKVDKLQTYMVFS